MPSLLDILPLDLMSKVLALATCTRAVYGTQWLEMPEAGKSPGSSCNIWRHPSSLR